MLTFVFNSFSNDKNNQINKIGARKLWWLNVEINLSLSQKVIKYPKNHIKAIQKIERKITFLILMKSLFWNMFKISIQNKIKFENKIKLWDFSQYKGKSELLMERLDTLQINKLHNKI